MAGRPKTIDEYLAALNKDQRAALEKLRRTIRAVAPNARECISYGLAAFRLDGKALVAIGAKANHCAFYPMSSSTVAEYRRELEGYDTSKGTIRFPARKPLPAALVRKLVKARMAENAGQSGKVRRVESKLDARRKVPRVKSSSRPDVGGRSPASAATKAPPRQDVDAVIATLKRSASKRTLDGMARYGIPSDHAMGVSVGTLRKLANGLGRNHALAVALWGTRWYEARMLAAFVDEPAKVTPAQMDRWCRDFDNWAICDTVCFHLFDRTPHAWTKVREWSERRPEFSKRAAFALLWGLTVHDKRAGDEPFLQSLRLVERAATDERHFVKKAVNMALRAIGKRSRVLNGAAVATAERLSAAPSDSAQWVGRDARRELTSAAVTKRLAARG